MKLSTFYKKVRGRIHFGYVKSERERQLGRHTAKFIFDLRDQVEDELIAAERLDQKGMIDVATGRADILDKVIAHGRKP